MRFNLAQLLKEGVGARRSFSLNETFEPLTETGTTKVRGSVTLTRMDKGVWASGRMEANAFTMCARCLTLTEHPVRFRVDEEYAPTVEINGVVPAAAPEVQGVKEEVFTLDAHHTMDLTEAVRQYVIINLPLKPLCSQDCAGLCATCGINLNDRRCECSTPVDPRWSPLLGLLTADGRG